MYFHMIDARPHRRDNIFWGRNDRPPQRHDDQVSVPTTVKALERALTRAEFDRPATDSAPFFFYRTQRVTGHDPPT